MNFQAQDYQVINERTKFYEVPISSHMGGEILGMVNSFLNKTPEKLSRFESQTNIVFKNMIFYSTMVLPSEIKRFRDIAANDPLFNHLIGFIQKYNLKFSFIGGEHHLTALKFSNGVSAKYGGGGTVLKAFAHGPMPSFILHETAHFIYYQLLSAEERVKQFETNKIMPFDKELTNILGKVRDYFKNRPDLLQVGLRSLAKGDVNNPNDLLIDESFAYFIDRVYEGKPSNVIAYKKKVFEILSAFGVAATPLNSTDATTGWNGGWFSQQSQVSITSSAVENNEKQATNPAVPADELKTGGIDLRGMPIVRQPVNVGAGLVPARNNGRPQGSPLQGTGAAPFIRPDNNWLQIEKMINAGIIPSPEKIRGYLVSSSLQDADSAGADYDLAVIRALCCIAAIMRLEEGDPVMKSKWKELLRLLESDVSSNRLQIELKQLVFLPK